MRNDEESLKNNKYEEISIENDNEKTSNSSKHFALKLPKSSNNYNHQYS